MRHPSESGRLEEDWLFEAITDVYMPLLSSLEGWRRDGVDARITMSLTPPLSSMLRDELLQRRYIERLEQLITLAEQECRRHRGGLREPLIRMYLERLEDTLRDYREEKDLLARLGDFQSTGQLEIAASAATHAYLPLLGVDPTFARAQIRVGVRHYRETFKTDPRGFWLPECGFEPGLDRMLADEGIRYFLLDTHGATNADPPPQFGHFAPIVTQAGVVAFAREPALSEKVWSGDVGYPGHPSYRERYRDAGFDLDTSDLDGLVLSDGERRAVGLKFHRITGPEVHLADKDDYDRLAAIDTVERHASAFVDECDRLATDFAAKHDRRAVIVAPYDAELFGHWWYEGPEFINRVVRLVASREALHLATPTDVIDGGERFQLVTPARSSWGRGGHAATWLDPSTDWIWPRLHDAADRMANLATERREAVGIERRAIQQLGRELLLASASDWPFILSNQTVVEYAQNRVREHLARFDALHDAICADAIDEAAVESFEREDNVLPELDPSDFVRT